ALGFPSGISGGCDPDRFNSSDRTEVAHALLISHSFLVRLFTSGVAADHTIRCPTPPQFSLSNSQESAHAIQDTFPLPMVEARSIRPCCRRRRAALRAGRLRSDGA